jgi:hypothetical protein
MDVTFRISPSNASDGQLIDVCAPLTTQKHRLLVPKTLSRVVDYGPDRPKVSVDLELYEGRLEVDRLNIERHTEYISTFFLTHLALPKVIRQVAISAIPNSSHWLSPEESVLEHEDEYLVQLYWFEYLSWGSPRTALMEATGWSRPNTNWHLRKLSKRFAMPGPHAQKADTTP